MLSDGINTLNQLMNNFFNPRVNESTLPSMIAVIADDNDIKTGTIKSVSMTWSGTMSDAVTMNFLITIHDESQPLGVKLTDAKIDEGKPILQTVSLSLKNKGEIELTNLKVTSITFIANSITTVYPTTKYNYVQRFRIEPIELSLSANIPLESYTTDYKNIADSFNTTDGLVVVKVGTKGQTKDQTKDEKKETAIITMDVRPLNFSVNFSQPILSVSLSGFYVS